MLLLILRKLHVLEKSDSSVMAQNALNKSDCSILWSSISLEGINQYLRFLFWDNNQGKIGLRLLVLFGRGQLGPCPVRLQDSLIINITGRNQTITLHKDSHQWKFASDWSSRPEVFYKKGVLRNFAKFTRKHLCQSLFFNKVAGLRTPPVAASDLRILCVWFC